MVILQIENVKPVILSAKLAMALVVINVYLANLVIIIGLLKQLAKHFVLMDFTKMIQKEFAQLVCLLVYFAQIPQPALLVHQDNI